MASFTLKAFNGGLEILNPLFSTLESVIEPVVIALDTLLFPLASALVF
ncbi:hypothetical protein [Thioalkalivibrio sp. ALJT]|nr:hypothetical protein [Thioalkalivibrio sp. ALJT]